VNSLTISGTVSNSTDATNKSYVDTLVASGSAINAGNQLSKTGNTLNVSATPSFTSVSIANAPSVNTDACNKLYVDSAVSSGVSGSTVSAGTNLSKSGNVISTVSSPSFSSVSISNTPSASTDGTNKSYVDSQITANTISAGNQLSKTGNTLNVSATPSFSSVSIANTPSVGTDGCNKSYVDSAVSSGVSGSTISAGTNLQKVSNVMSTVSNPSFTSITISGSPTNSTDAATKGYTDSQITANTISAGTNLSKTAEELEFQEI